MYRRALAIAEKAQGPEHPSTGARLNNLAVFLRNVGRLEEAEPLQREAVVRIVRANGEDSIQAASTYSAMAVLMKLKGERNEAEKYLRKALLIRQKKLGSDNPATQLVRKRLEELLTSGAQNG